MRDAQRVDMAVERIGDAADVASSGFFTQHALRLRGKGFPPLQLNSMTSWKSGMIGCASSASQSVLPAAAIAVGTMVHFNAWDVSFVRFVLPCVECYSVMN